LLARAKLGVLLALNEEVQGLILNDWKGCHCLSDLNNILSAG